MYERPTHEQIQAILAEARAERARTMRRGLAWIGRALSQPFRTRQPERRTA